MNDRPKEKGKIQTERIIKYSIDELYLFSAGQHRQTRVVEEGRWMVQGKQLKRVKLNDGRSKPTRLGILGELWYSMMVWCCEAMISLLSLCRLKSRGVGTTGFSCVFTRHMHMYTLNSQRCDIGLWSDFLIDEREDPPFSFSFPVKRKLHLAPHR